MPKYDSVWDIPWYSNRGKINSIVIEDGVTSIEVRAFKDCTALTSVTIGNSVTSIGSSAFSGCSGLTSVTIPNSVKSIERNAFDGCSGLTSITIPNSVTSIGMYAFSGCSSLTSITIPNSMTSIGERAFFGCSGLTSITIPNSVTSIGEFAFSGCSSLTSITIPNSMTSIGQNAFYNCSGLTSITIPNSVTSIEEFAFSLCSGLTSVTIPNSVTSIGSSAFSGCSGLTSVTIPNSVTSIGSSAFSGCSGLTSVTIPNSVTSIGNYVFRDCSGLTSVTIPNSVTSIGSYAFYGCSGLTSITIPNSVTSIEKYAFFGCSGLNSVTIPSSVTSIGQYAFFNCKGLTSITFERSTPPTFGEDVFKYVDKSIPVYVPSSSVDEYKKALGGYFEETSIQPITIYLTDDEAYTQKSQVDDVEVSYTRNFTNTNWQALYLPFSLKYEDWKDDFEVAYINGVRQEDTNDDGTIDNTILEFVKMNGGSTAPNTPYIIRAKSTGEKTLSAQNATVYPAERNTVDCSTTAAKFTFTGTIFTASFSFMRPYYTMSDNKLEKLNGSSVPPYHWYMKIESRNSGYAKYYNPAKEITISVLDDEETTGISQMQVENRQSSVYDINGRKVNENSLKPGMYIKNGRKFVVR